MAAARTVRDEWRASMAIIWKQTKQTCFHISLWGWGWHIFLYICSRRQGVVSFSNLNLLLLLLLIIIIIQKPALSSSSIVSNSSILFPFLSISFLFSLRLIYYIYIYHNHPYSSIIYRHKNIFDLSNNSSLEWPKTLLEFLSLALLVHFLNTHLCQ